MMIDDDTHDSKKASYDCRAATCVLLLRILQKMTKRNEDRIKNSLLRSRSIVTLKRALKTGYEPLMYYAMKLIKGQIRYKGRRWRQQNMKIISAIYRNIRVDICDGWLVSAGSEDEDAMLLNHSHLPNHIIKIWTDRFNDLEYYSTWSKLPFYE